MKSIAVYRTERLAAGMTLAGVALLAAYWIGFAVVPPSGSQRDTILRGFEAAFPVADLFLAGALVAASILLRRPGGTGNFWLVAAGSATLYLGLLDLTFLFTAGLHRPFDVTSAIHLLSSLICLSGGAAGLRWGWTLWHAREERP